MDTSDFLVKRDEIQLRMQTRRLDAAEAASQRHGIVPWLFKAGMGAMGLRSNGTSWRWLTSLVWTALVPLAVKYAQRSSESFVQRLVNAVLPGGRRK